MFKIGWHIITYLAGNEVDKIITKHTYFIHSPSMFKCLIFNQHGFPKIVLLYKIKWVKKVSEM